MRPVYTQDCKSTRSYDRCTVYVKKAFKKLGLEVQPLSRLKLKDMAISDSNSESL